MKTATLIGLMCFSLADPIPSPALAFVACNHADCWHTHQKVTAPGINFVFHPDDWYFHHDWRHGGVRWHGCRTDNGYWRDGVWIAAG